MKEQMYLGDGLYAEFDGFQFALKANSLDNPTDTVYLDPYVVDKFKDFVKRCYNINQETEE